jgi:hypothetical protein
MATEQDIVAHRHGLEQGEILKRPTDSETGNAMTRQLQQTLTSNKQCQSNQRSAADRFYRIILQSRPVFRLDMSDLEYSTTVEAHRQ